MNVVGERVAVGDFHFLAGAEGEDMRGVLAALLIEYDGSGRNRTRVGRALGNVHDHVADGIAWTYNERFGKERIGGVHLRTGGVFWKNPWVWAGPGGRLRGPAPQVCGPGA